MSKFKMRRRPIKPKHPILSHHFTLYDQVISYPKFVELVNNFAKTNKLESVDNVELHLVRYITDWEDIEYSSLQSTESPPLAEYNKKLEKYNKEVDEYNKWKKEHKDQIKEYNALKKKEKLERKKAARIAELEKQLKQLKGN